MSICKLPRPAAEILKRGAPVLAELQMKDFSIGGGTALVARWGHRRSVDVHCIVPPEEFERTRRRIVPRLEADPSMREVRATPGRISALCESGEFSIAGAPRLFPGTATSQDSDIQSGTRLEPVAEILANKLRRLTRGPTDLLSHDLYDICTASEWDPLALELALSVVTRDVRNEIADEIMRLGPDAAHTGHPIKGMHRPDWLGNLGARAVKLLAAPAFAEGDKNSASADASPGPFAIPDPTEAPSPFGS